MLLVLGCVSELLHSHKAAGSVALGQRRQRHQRRQSTQVAGRLVLQQVEASDAQPSPGSLRIAHWSQISIITLGQSNRQRSAWVEWIQRSRDPVHSN